MRTVIITLCLLSFACTPIAPSGHKAVRPVPVNVR